MPKRMEPWAGGIVEVVAARLGTSSYPWPVVALGATSAVDVSLGARSFSLFLPL